MDKHVGAQVTREVASAINADFDLEGLTDNRSGCSDFLTVDNATIVALEVALLWDSSRHDDLVDDLQGFALCEGSQGHKAHTDADGLWWVVEGILLLVSHVKLASLSELLKSISHGLKTIFEFSNGPKLEVVLSVVVNLDDNLITEAGVLAVVLRGLSQLEGDLTAKLLSNHGSFLDKREEVSQIFVQDGLVCLFDLKISLLLLEVLESSGQHVFDIHISTNLLNSFFEGLLNLGSHRYFNTVEGIVLFFHGELVGDLMISGVSHGGILLVEVVFEKEH